MNISHYFTTYPASIKDFTPPSSGEPAAAVNKAVINQIITTPQRASVFQPAFNQASKKSMLGMANRTVKLPDNMIFDAPIYDFTEIDKVTRIEAFVMRAFNTLTSLSLGGSAKNKYGFHLESRNPKAKEYITARLEELTFAIGGKGSVYSMMRKIIDNIVKKSNAILWIRREDRSDDKYEWAGRQNNKIVGLEVVDPSQVELARDGDDAVTVVGYKLTTAAVEQVIKNRDCVHLRYNQICESDFFGCPLIIPVLNDILSLRRIEEIMDLALGKATFPLYHIAIGDDAHNPKVFGNAGKDNEIARARQDWEDMSPEGSYITPGYYKVTVVQPRDVADFKPYMDWYRERIFSGLMMDGPTMGLGNAGSRQTSNLMNQNLINKVRDIQISIQDQLTSTIIRELLVEGGFKPVGADAVYLVFDEIDLESLMAYENHVLAMFQGSLLTFDEARRALGKDPMSDEDLNNNTYLPFAAKTEAKYAPNPTMNKPANQFKKSPAKPSKARKRDIAAVWSIFNRSMNTIAGMDNVTARDAVIRNIASNLAVQLEQVYDVPKKELTDKLMPIVADIKDRILPTSTGADVRAVFDSNRYKIELLCDSLEEIEDDNLSG